MFDTCRAADTDAVRVLVVEDETRMAALLKRGLEEDGYAVDVAASGVDALWQGPGFGFSAGPPAGGGPGGGEPPAAGCRCSCSPPGTRWRTAYGDWTPVRMTTWRSRSALRS